MTTTLQKQIDKLTTQYIYGLSVLADVETDRLCAAWRAMCHNHTLRILFGNGTHVITVTNRRTGRSYDLQYCPIDPVQVHTSYGCATERPVTAKHFCKALIAYMKAVYLITDGLTRFMPDDVIID